MRKIILVSLSLMLVVAAGAVARDLTGQQILNGLGFKTILSGSGAAELNLITENDKGVQRSSSVRVYLKSDGQGDKQFLEYLNPADVRGTKFLSLHEKGQEDQMWLYMPALGRERRIASHMTGDSFMGTDFTYEEIGGNFAEEDQYGAVRLEDQNEQGLDCYVLDLTAREGDVLYKKIKMWVWKEEMVPVRVEFMDGAGTLQKTLTLSNFKPVSGEMIPHSVIMADNVKGTRTLLEITEISEEDVSDEIFTVRNLRR